MGLYGLILLILFVSVPHKTLAKLPDGATYNNNYNNNIPQPQQDDDNDDDSLEGDIFAADDLLQSHSDLGPLKGGGGGGGVKTPPPFTMMGGGGWPSNWFNMAGGVGGGGGVGNVSGLVNPFGQLAVFFGPPNPSTSITSSTSTTSSQQNNSSRTATSYNTEQQQQQLHFADYNFLFNAERHTIFQLHTAILPPSSTATASTSTTIIASNIMPQANKPTNKAGNRLQRHSHNRNDNNYSTKMSNATATAAQNRILFNAIGAAFGINSPSQMAGNTVASGGNPTATTTTTTMTTTGSTTTTTTNTGTHVEEVLLNSATSLRQSRFNPFNPTRILIHGWLGGAHAGIYQTLVPAYMRLSHAYGRAYNIFTVDWGRGAIAEYIMASYRVKSVGQTVARFIDFLHAEAGMRFEDLEVIGFSMGAHIAGMVGKYVQTGRLPLIYALDPALPFFRHERISERVAITDADYVEVIHTSVGSYGYDRPLGHADFYVNYGSQQPGCFLNECNHVRAFQVFADTLRPSMRSGSSSSLSSSTRIESPLWGIGCAVNVWQDMVRHRRCIMPTGLRMAMGGDAKNVTALRGRGGVYYVTATTSAPFMFP